MGRSFYGVELSVAPSGLRDARIFAYTDGQHVLDLLQSRLTRAALSWDTICIWIVEQGKVREFVDLLPLITVHRDGQLSRTMESLLSGDFRSSIGEAQDDASTSLTWDRDAVRARLPDLNGKLLQRGQSTIVEAADAFLPESYMAQLGTQIALMYGPNDLESETGPYGEEDPVDISNEGVQEALLVPLQVLEDLAEIIIDEHGLEVLFWVSEPELRPCEKLESNARCVALLCRYMDEDGDRIYGLLENIDGEWDLRNGPLRKLLQALPEGQNARAMETLDV